MHACIDTGLLFEFVALSIALNVDGPSLLGTVVRQRVTRSSARSHKAQDDHSGISVPMFTLVVQHLKVHCIGILLLFLIEHVKVHVNRHMYYASSA